MNAYTSYYTDSGVLNGAFVVTLSGTVTHIRQQQWRLNKTRINDDGLARSLNGVLRRYTVQYLAQISGNSAMNDAVYSMNQWYQ